MDFFRSYCSLSIDLAFSQAFFFSFFFLTGAAQGKGNELNKGGMFGERVGEV